MKINMLLVVGKYISCSVCVLNFNWKKYGSTCTTGLKPILLELFIKQDEATVIIVYKWYSVLMPVKNAFWGNLHDFG